MTQKVLIIIVLTFFSTASFAQAPAIEWQKSFGGTLSEGANCIRQTNDLGYIICGGSYSNDINVSGNHGNYDYWIVKIDTNQSITWQK